MVVRPVLLDRRARWVLATLALAASACSAGDGSPVTPTIAFTIVPLAERPPEPPAPVEDPIPACEVRAARTPVAFVTEGPVAVQLLPAADRGLAEVQAVLEGWVGALGDHTDGDCHVVRNDGELLSLRCTSMLFTGNGSMRGGPEEAFAFARTEAGWKRMTLADMLPAAQGDARKLLAPMCAERKSIVNLAELGLTPPAHAGDAWLNVIEPAAEGLHLQVGSGPNDSAHCVLPYDAVMRPAGCGPLAPLARPALLTEPVASGPLGPLEVVRVNELSHDGDWHFPRVSSRDPRRQPIVTAINRDIEAWRLSAAASNPANLACDVTMSTDSLVSVLCTGTEGGEGPKQAGLTYRLADGARIGPELLFASNAAAVRVATKRCVGEHVRRPKNEHDESLEKLPTWSPAQFAAFGLAGDSVRFVVAFDAKTRKGEIRPRSAYCHMRYAELKTTPEALAKPKP